MSCVQQTSLVTFGVSFLTHYLLLKCIEYDVEGSWPRNRLEELQREVEKDCQACKLNEDAMDHNIWKKLIEDVWWSGWVKVGECVSWYRPTWVVPDKGQLNGCVCVLCIYIHLKITVCTLTASVWDVDKVNWETYLSAYALSVKSCGNSSPWLSAITCKPNKWRSQPATNDISR